MKRLLALTGFTCFLVLAAVFYFGEIASTWVIGISALGFVITVAIPKTRKDKTMPVGFLTAVLICLWLNIFTLNYVNPVKESYADKTAQVCITQKTHLAYNNGFYFYEAAVNTIDGEDVDSGLLVLSKGAFYTEPGDKLTFSCDLVANNSRSYTAKGIYLRTYIDEMPELKVESPTGFNFLRLVSDLRLQLEKGLRLELDYEAADFSSALLLGDKYAISPEVNDVFRSCGISHIVVVSGMHLSIITMIVSKVIYKFIKGRIISSTVIIVFIVSFAVMTGFGFSVRRAMVVQLVLIFGGMFRRRADSLNSLGLAALLIILPNPYAAADVGFQLSLLSTMGILILSNRLYYPAINRIEKVKFFKLRPVLWITKTVLGTFFTSLSAFVFTLPIMILIFEGFSLVSILVNVLIVPFMTLALMFSLLCATLHYVTFFPLLADTFAFLLEVFYDFLISVSTFFSNLPFSYIQAKDIYFVVWLCSSMMLVGIALLINTRRGYFITVILSLMILFGSGGVYKLTHDNVLTIRIPDTGGLSVILESTSGHCLLKLDGHKSKSYLVMNEVSKFYKSPGDVAIGYGDKSSDNYLADILCEFDYPTVLRYDNKDNELDGSLSTEDIILFEDSYCIDLWDKAKLNVFAVDDCVYEYLETENTSVLILPEFGNAEDIPKIYRSPEILITESIIENMGLIECETLIVPGDDYMASLTAEVSAAVSEEIILDTGIVYDIR